MSGSQRSSVLLVFKDIEVVQNYRKVLRHNGMSVQISTSSDKAWEHLEKETFDLILMETTMPLENGYQFMRRCKQMKRFDGLQKILIGNSLEKADHFWANEVGANKLIGWPPEPDDILSHLQFKLSGHRD